VNSDFNLLLTQRTVFTSGLAPLEKLVALALLDHWSRSGETFPSVVRLSRWTSLSRCAVMRALSSLKAKGAILVQETKGRVHRYDLGPLGALPNQSPRETGLSERPVSHEDTHRSPRETSTGLPERHEGIHRRNPSKEPTKRARAVARRSTSKAPIVESPNESAEHKALTALYFNSYESARGAKPPFDKRDGKAVKDLLAKCGAEVAAAAIRGAFVDGFWKDKVTIRGIANEPAKFVGLKANGGGNRRGPVQPNGGGWEPVME
jgi:DNA-binding transcriptional ArsR family regulator